MSSFNAQLPVFEKLKKANVKELIILSLSTYLVFSVISFFVLHFFLQIYLSGLLKSQNYSVSTQQWRTVLNGLRSGWYAPEIKSLQIYRGKELIVGWGEAAPYSSVSGLGVIANYKSYKVVISFKYSIWLLAFILPLLGLMFVYFIYLPLKGPLLRNNYLKILGDIERIFTSEPSEIKKLNDFEKIIKDQADKIVHLSKKAVIGDIAKQVAHDIRSPLGALDIVINSGSELTTEKKDLLKSATRRIQDIAEDLLDKNRVISAGGVSDSPKEVKEIMVSTRSQISDVIRVTDDIIELKKIEFESSEISLKFYKETCSNNQVFCNLKEYSRILSNLINNSFESIIGDGYIIIDLFETSKTLLIEVRDNGKGIPGELLARVSDKGFTFGKENGNGLGLSYAKERIESWGGKLLIVSIVDQGTKINLELQKDSKKT